MNDITTIFFDFDGVLCKDRFYTNLKDNYPYVYDFIQSNVFNQDSEIPNLRMKNLLIYDKVNAFISSNTDIDYNLLNKLFLQSVDDMKIDNRLLDYAQQLKHKGKKIALITNNMDVFDTIIIPNYNLDSIFHVIINSCNYGILKHEHDGRLFDIAMDKLGVDDYSQTLLIDDSDKACEMFCTKGGNYYKYSNYKNFIQWIQENEGFTKTRNSIG